MYAARVRGGSRRAGSVWRGGGDEKHWREGRGEVGRWGEGEEAAGGSGSGRGMQQRKGH